jgi:hypothetical protein
MPAQSDTWWQLRAGQDMWQSGRLMLADEYTHTVFGQRWPNHEWLTQVLFFGAYSAGGMALLTGLCALAVTLAWAIVASLTPGVPLVRVALLGGGAVLTAASWTLRPQVLTMTLFAATLWILVRRRAMWTLPLLFVVWANLHGAVVLGGILIGAAVIASFITRDGSVRALIGVGALCLAATAVTPLGWSLWLEIPVSLQRLQAYGVEEWRAPGLRNGTDIGFWVLGATAAGVMLVRRHLLRSTAMVMLAISTVLLFIAATRSARNITPFVLCAIPALATLLETRAREPRTRERSMLAPNAALLAVSVAFGVFFIARAWSTPLPRLQWNPMSSEAVAAIASCEGRLYNRYDEGGYLIWFIQDRKVFLDNRQDPFPEDLVLEHIRVEQSGDYAAMFEQFDIGCALTPVRSVLGARLKAHGWAERRAGPVWNVYSRPGPRVSSQALARGL